MDLHVFPIPILIPLPPHSPSHSSGSSQCTSPEHLSHASSLGWWSVSHLIIYTCFNTILFSSRSFIVYGLTFLSLIYFEFIFVYGFRKCSSFILLQVVDQFSQHHLLKRLSFFHLYILASFVKDKVSIGTWIYLCAFFFVPLIYISVFVPVPYCPDDCSFVVEPEVRHVDSSSSILLSQDGFGYLRFFVVPYKLWNYLF